MKYLKLSALLALSAAAFIASPANASNFSGAAGTACKAHIADLHPGELNRKVKRIRTRGNQVTVNVRVTADGERFNAQYLVSKTGELTYTTDREMTDAIVSKDS